VKKATQATAKTLKQLPLDLSADFVLRLDAFCEAFYGAPRARVIREAVTEFIKRELENNAGAAERFEAAEQRLRKERFTVVGPTPIKPRSPREE
jgi:hypothetical protein